MNGARSQVTPVLMIFNGGFSCLEIISKFVEREEYVPEVCNRLGRTISENITKYLHPIEEPTDRQHKYACLVYIGAVKDCGISAAAQALWSPEEDRFIVIDYQNKTMYVIAVVLAIP
ncbi:hypothetical protein QZH41_002759 [Actinostola sp. cb2023]|nr:hypothetical protein QZH41_002759 [Actinostola sp. cb2023]